MSSFLSVLIEEESSSQAGTPLDYGGPLRQFLDAENRITLSGVDVLEWGDNDPDNVSTVFDVPGGARSPEFEAVSQNGLPGVNFQQPVGQTFLNRKLTASASAVDDWWARTGTQSLAFAGKLNRLTDTTFNTRNTIAEKGYRQSGGWQLTIDSSGTLAFEQRRSDNSVWKMEVPGFYSVGDLVLGYMNYDGGNTTGSGFFRIFDGSDFITAGTISPGAVSGIGTDTLDEMTIGNSLDPLNANFNAPFEGPLFGLWMTTEAVNTFDEGYLSRWIP
ncbi:MAG: hypothetical protein ACR2QF_16595 [Geminicoccaceae bacterium]